MKQHWHVLASRYSAAHPWLTWRACCQAVAGKRRPLLRPVVVRARLPYAEN